MNLKFDFSKNLVNVYQKVNEIHGFHNLTILKIGKKNKFLLTVMYTKFNF